MLIYFAVYFWIYKQKSRHLLFYSLFDWRLSCIQIVELQVSDTSKDIEVSMVQCQ